MKTKIISIYTENADFQYLETLQRNRAKRNQLQEFLVEGVRPLTQALQYGWHVRALVYSPQKRLSQWAQGVLSSAQAQCHYELPASLMTKLSQKDETSELMAVLGMADDDFQRIPERECPLVVVLDRPSNPGNLGSIIRTADALGVDGLVVTGHAVDIYDPETIRATTGSFFALPVIRKSSQQDLLPWLEQLKAKHSSLQIVGSSARASLPIQEHDFTRPTVLLVGSESRGLSAGYKALCDALVRIPMSGSASSLNAACAASILLYEVSRQRGLSLNR